MADNVIDTLSIKINSSAGGVRGSVDNVIKHLTKLEGYLNKFSSSTDGFASAIDSISDGLETLNVTIGKIDIKGLERTSTALSSLSSSARKLNNAFGNIGMDKATKDAKALESQMDKTVKSFMDINMISPEVSDKMKKLFSEFSSGVTFKNGAFSDISDSGSQAYINMVEVMMNNVLKKSKDTIDGTTRKIVDYANKNKTKVSLPFKISDIDVGNEHNKSPKEMLASVFGVGNWTTSGTGGIGLDKFIEDFNSATGSTIKADESVEAFNQLANVILNAKQSMNEFNTATIQADIDMDAVWHDLVQMATAMNEFETKLKSTSAQVTNNPFTQLSEGLRSLTTVGTIPDLTGVASLAESIGKLGYKNALAGIANLPVLVQGLQSLNQLGSINVPDLTGLARFIEVISTLGYKKANNATANLRPLINGVRELATLNGLQFPTEQIASLATSFSIFGRSTTANATTNIPQLAEAFKRLMQTLSTAPRVSNNVIALANAMAKLSANGAKVGSASRSLDASLQRVSNSMSSIGARMRSLSGRVLDFGKTLLLSGTHATNTGRRYETLASKIGLLYAKFWILLRAVRALNGMISVASSLIEVQNVVDTTFGNMSYKIEDFSKNAIKNFGLSELAAKQTASRFQSMGTAMGITGQQVEKAQQFLNMRKTLEGNVVGYDKMSKSMADMSINLTKLSADMASFYDIEQSTVEKALASGVLAGQTRPLRQYGLDLTNATLKVWAMKNGLDANIKSMTQAQKTLLRYQYVMANTSKVQGDFSRTANTWHNQIVILKMQLQQLATVIGSGLIQAIKPFVMQMNAALSGLITFAQNVVNALGKIFGWEMEINTKGLTLDEEALEDIDTSGLEDIGDSADESTKAVKKLKDQLQGFDKLNVLRTTEQNKNKSNKSGTDSDSGTGNGSGVSGGEASSMLKKTKGAFESDIDSLYELGKYIQDKLISAMDSIKWDKIYEKAENFGKGLAEFLNGLISPKLFKKLANLIDNALRTALIALNSFAMNFDFENLGKSIEAGIIELLKNFPWSELKENAKNWAEGLADLLNNAITKDSMSAVGEALAEAINTAFEFLKTFGEDFNWENFGASLGAGLNSFLSNLDWKKYFSTAKTWGKGIANALNAFVDETDFYLVGESISKAIKTAVLFFLSLGSTIDWKDLGVALADTINGAIENFPAKEFADTLDAWVQGIFDGLVAALTHVHWNSLGDKIVEFISNIDLKTIEIALSAIALKKGASFAVKVAAGILAFAKEKLLLEIANALKNGIGLKELVVNLKNIAWMLPGTPVFDVGATALLEKLWDAIYNGMPATFQSWYTKFDTFIKDTVIGGFMNMMENAFKSAFNMELWDKGAEHFKQGGIHIIQGLAEGLGAVAQYLTNPLQNIFNHIWNTLCDLFGISSPAEKMKPIGKYIIEGILEGFKLPDFGSAFQWVGDKFSGLQTILGGKMNAINTTISEKWDSIMETAVTKIEDIKNKVDNKFERIKTVITTKIDFAKEHVGTAWKTIKNVANANIPEIATSVGEKFSNVISAIKRPFSSVGNFFQTTWNNIKNLCGNGVVGIHNEIVKKFNDMMDKLKGIGKTLQGLFKFKLPTFHFETTTLELANLKITYPSGIRAEWHRKAYDNPLMFTKPTVMPTSLGYHGFGDGPGGEMVYGHANLMKDIREATGGSEMTAIGNRQLANDQRIIQLLSIIAEKEFGISGDELFRSVRNQASNYTKRTGQQAFAF